MRRVHLDELVPVPWKNGGGTTRELAVFPEGASFSDFVWRVSLADVRASGPFSSFPAIDRTILLLDGAGMTLSINGTDVPLTTPLAPVRFAGEDAVHATLAGGASRDFNLMVRGSAAMGDLNVLREGTQIASRAGDTHLFLSVDGTWQMNAPDAQAATLERSQAVIISPAQPGTITLIPTTAAATCIAITISPLEGHSDA